MPKRIAVLCRGKSLGEYRNYSHLFEKIYIVARFYKEIKKLGIKHFEDKKIIHVVARTSQPLRYGFYDKLNIPYVQTFCHSLEKEFKSSYGKSHIDKYPKGLPIRIVPPCMRKRGLEPLSAEIIEEYCHDFKSYKKLNAFLKKNKAREISLTKRRTRYWPTTGVFALDLALTENKPKEIYLFGLDMYAALTYIQYSQQEFRTLMDDNITRLGVYYIKQLVEEYKNVKFYSSSKVLKFDLPNWNLF